MRRVVAALASATATAGSDYTGSTSCTIDWADGDADPKWLEFDIVDDGQGDTDEFFDLSLTASRGAILGARTAVRVNIEDGSGGNRAPNAVTGAGVSVQSGDSVTLDSRASNDPDGDALNYLWTQTLGPGVALDDATAATATFTAPTVSAATALEFRLLVTDPGGNSDTATLNVTVRPQVASNSGGGGGAIGALLCLVLAGMRRARCRSTRKDAA